MQLDEIRTCIEAGLPDSQVLVDGDGTHFSAVVVSELFAGKTLVQQHQLVYKSLGEKVGSDIHALTIKTFTPEEWQKFSGSEVV
jgi:acid stress-induced BolA-like protein IbaG/YrbA